jgi:hypothetical protein
MAMPVNHKVKKAIDEMLKISRRVEARITQLHHEEDDLLSVPLDDIALDLLGVPQDNTLEMYEKYGELAYERPETFCRGYFTDVWCGWCEEKDFIDDAGGFIRIVSSVLDEWGYTYEPETEKWILKSERQKLLFPKCNEL